MKATVKAESPEFIRFYRDLSAPAMSTDMSQVGCALFPSFYFFYNFTSPDFPSIFIQRKAHMLLLGDTEIYYSQMLPFNTENKDRISVNIIEC